MNTVASFTSQAPLVFLWHASWQAAILLGLALLLNHCLPRPRCRANLLHASLVLCGLASLLAALIPKFVLLADPLPAWVPLVHPADTEVQTPLSDPWSMLAAGMLAIWLTGMAIHAARIVQGWIRVRRVLRASRPFADERVGRLLHEIGAPTNLDLRVLANLPSPFCWQMHRPALILPRSMLLYSDEDLMLLLRHEIAHLRGGDPLQLFLEHCLLALFWFHPLVHWAVRKAQCWREIACDEWALAAGGSPLRLARLLTDLAEQTTRPRHDAWRLAAQGVASDWQLRMQRLVAQRRAAETSRLLPGGILVLVALVAMLLAVVRLAGPFPMARPGQWTHWPRAASTALDIVGVQVVDFDLRRASHDPREQTPEHRRAHRRR